MIPKFDNPEFKGLLKQKEIEIYLKTSGGIQETENFKLVHRLIVSFREQKSINEFKAILVKIEDIENIPGDIKDKLFHSLSTHEAITNNHIFVDKDFDLKHCERNEIKNNNDARKI